MNTPRMFYFGPWDSAGHYFFGPGGSSVDRETEKSIPWGSSGGWKIDGGLIRHKNYYEEGRATLTHEYGWTAVSFWDMTVDSRPNSSSTYVAEGTFTFDEMVAMAKARFAHRWNKMKFEVRLVSTSGLDPATAPASSPHTPVEAKANNPNKEGESK